MNPVILNTNFKSWNNPGDLSLPLNCASALKIYAYTACPNTEFFLVRIFAHSYPHTSYLSVFSPNVGKYGPEKTPYLDTFHVVPGFRVASNPNKNQPPLA